MTGPARDPQIRGNATERARRAHLKRRLLSRSAINTGPGSTPGSEPAQISTRVRLRTFADARIDALPWDLTGALAAQRDSRPRSPKTHAQKRSEPQGSATMPLPPSCGWHSTSPARVCRGTQWDTMLTVKISLCTWPLSSRPPAITMCPPRDTAARSERPTGNAPTCAHLAACRYRQNRRVWLVAEAPRPPNTNTVPFSAAAAACVSGLGSTPSIVSFPVTGSKR